MNKFDNDNSIQSKGIVSFINTVRPRVRLITFHSTSVGN